MADRFPLVVNPQTRLLEELAEYDNLNLTNSGIVGASTIFANRFFGNLTGTATTSLSLSSGANILSGTISSERLSGFYNIGVSTASALSNAENIISGIIQRERLSGSYDINVTGIAETSNSLSDASRILDGIIPQDRLTGVYNIDITGTAFSAVGAAASVTLVERDESPNVHFITFSDLTNRDVSVFSDSNSLTYIPLTNRLGIGTNLPLFNIDVNGSARFSGITSVNVGFANTFNISSLNNVVGIDSTTRLTLEQTLDINNLVSLSVAGFTTLSNFSSSDQASLNNLRVSGITTLNRVVFSSSSGSIDAPRVDTTYLNVTGIATFNNISIGATPIIGTDRILSNIIGIDTSTRDVLTEALKIDFFENLATLGVGTIGGKVIITNGLEVDNQTTLQYLDVVGVATIGSVGIGSTLITTPSISAGQVAISSNLQVSGGLKVSGVTSSLRYYGDGSTLNGVITAVLPGIGITVSPANNLGQVTVHSFTPVGKTIFVSQSGNDSNSGLTENNTKRTIKAAAAIALPGDTIKVFPGVYVENNPVILGKGVAVEGAELRNCIVSPQNPGLDLFHVNNSVHITDLSFQGQESQNGAAVVAFQPLLGVATDRFFDAARMIRMNLDFIASETVGYLTSTDYRSPAFVIPTGNPNDCKDDIKDVLKAVIHDITRGGNSKCVGAAKSYYNGNTLQHIVGVKTETIDALRYSAEITRNIINNSPWAGKPSGPEKSVTQAYYDNTTGITTITALSHGLSVGDVVRIEGIGFNCPSDGEATTVFYPSGNYGYTFEVLRSINANQFEVQVGPSTLPHNYVSGGTVQKMVNYQNRFTQVKDLSMQPDPFTGLNNAVSGCANVVSAIYSCVGVVTTIIERGPSFLGVGINTTYPGNAGAGTTIPNHPSFSPGVGPITQGPYIRNCTNFIPKSIGMKIDGFDAEPGDKDDIGVTGSMSVDSYTQYNQGGIGVSISNGAYAQLVSIFTICNQIAIYTESGGQCDLTNSNSSFGTFGLVSEGVGGPESKSIYRMTGVALTDAPRGQNIVEVSGVGSYRPYDGQAIYFDTLYNIVETIQVTDGGSGYTSPPRVTIDAPTGANGITAQATATIVDGSVTEITVITSGTQYASAPNVTISPPTGAGTTATAIVSELEPIYYTVLEASLPSAGISTISLAQNLNNTVSAGSTVFFSRLSLQLTSSHAFEFIGAGNTIEGARPAQGGVTIQENEVVQNNGGIVVFTSTDQAGNFRIGDGVVINQATGSISGRDFTKALFTTMTPFILALTE
jgi:hypothetical protein